jgi:hypothetical protein
MAQFNLQDARPHVRAHQELFVFTWHRSNGAMIRQVLLFDPGVRLSKSID